MKVMVKTVINHKKAILIILILLAITILGIVTYMHKYSAKTITNFFDNDVSKISRVDITNGNNGNVISVDDKKVISYISAYLSKLRLKKVFDKPSTGWSYRYSINENGKEALNITFNGDEFCRINELFSYFFYVIL